MKIIIWQQFGAAIDMLENAILACPVLPARFAGSRLVYPARAGWPAAHRPAVIKKIQLKIPFKIYK